MCSFNLTTSKDDALINLLCYVISLKSCRINSSDIISENNLKMLQHLHIIISSLYHSLAVPL